MQQIQATEVAQWAQSQVDAKPVVLDVREAWEVQQASIQAPEGAELVHISMGTVPLRVAELDKSRPIACLCHHGGRSMQVAMFLEGNGFGQIANIVGGIDAWSIAVDASVPRY